MLYYMIYRQSSRFAFKSEMTHPLLFIYILSYCNSLIPISYPGHTSKTFSVPQFSTIWINLNHLKFNLFGVAIYTVNVHELLFGEQGNWPRRIQMRSFIISSNSCCVFIVSKL